MPGWTIYFGKITINIDIFAAVTLIIITILIIIVILIIITIIIIARWMSMVSK